MNTNVYNMVDTRCDCWNYMLNIMHWPAPIAAAIQEYTHTVYEICEYLKRARIEIVTYRSLCVKDITIDVLPISKQLQINNSEDKYLLSRGESYPHIIIEYLKYSKFTNRAQLSVTYKISECISISLDQRIRKRRIGRLCEFNIPEIISYWKPLADKGISMPELFIAAFQNFQSALRDIIAHCQHVDISDCRAPEKRFIVKLIDR